MAKKQRLSDVRKYYLLFKQEKGNCHMQRPVVVTDLFNGMPIPWEPLSQNTLLLMLFYGNGYGLKKYLTAMATFWGNNIS